MLNPKLVDTTQRGMSRRSSGNPGLHWDDECRKRRVKPQRKRCNRGTHGMAPARPAIC